MKKIKDLFWNQNLSSTVSAMQIQCTRRSTTENIRSCIDRLLWQLQAHKIFTHFRSKPTFQLFHKVNYSLQNKPVGMSGMKHDALTPLQHDRYLKIILLLNLISHEPRIQHANIEFHTKDWNWSIHYRNSKKRKTDRTRNLHIGSNISCSDQCSFLMLHCHPLIQFLLQKIQRKE